RTSTALPHFASRRGVPALRAIATADARPLAGPEPRCFTFLWPAPRVPSGPAGALHGVSIEIRGRYPGLVAAARQVGDLGGVARQLDGFVVRRARLLNAARPAQQAGAGGMVGVIAGQRV